MIKSLFERSSSSESTSRTKRPAFFVSPLFFIYCWIQSIDYCATLAEVEKEEYSIFDFV